MKRVLIVEDKEPAARELIGRGEKFGLRFDWARSYDSAMKLVEHAGSYWAAIIDLLLPPTDAVEGTPDVRAQMLGPSIIKRLHETHPGILLGAWTANPVDRSELAAPRQVEEIFELCKERFIKEEYSGDARAATPENIVRWLLRNADSSSTEMFPTAFVLLPWRAAVTGVPRELQMVADKWRAAFSGHAEVSVALLPEPPADHVDATWLEDVKTTVRCAAARLCHVAVAIFTTDMLLTDTRLHASVAAIDAIVETVPTVKVIVAIAGDTANQVGVRFRDQIARRERCVWLANIDELLDTAKKHARESLALLRRLAQNDPLNSDLLTLDLLPGASGSLRNALTLIFTGRSSGNNSPAVKRGCHSQPGGDVKPVRYQICVLMLPNFHDGPWCADRANLGFDGSFSLVTSAGFSIFLRP